jgi:phosphatidylinositol alpha-mannosyltransferase
MKEIISNGKNGLLIPPGDADQLASAIINLMRDKDLRAMIIANGIDAVKKHDIQKVSSSIADIYGSLL